jgi:hypothetical protein
MAALPTLQSVTANTAAGAITLPSVATGTRRLVRIRCLGGSVDAYLTNATIDATTPFVIPAGAAVSFEINIGPSDLLEIYAGSSTTVKVMVEDLGKIA